MNIRKCKVPSLLPSFKKNIPSVMYILYLDDYSKESVDASLIN